LKGAWFTLLTLPVPRPTPVIMWCLALKFPRRRIIILDIVKYLYKRL
jgi:hypothetical protein